MNKYCDCGCKIFESDEPSYIDEEGYCIHPLRNTKLNSKRTNDDG